MVHHTNPVLLWKTLMEIGNEIAVHLLQTLLISPATSFPANKQSHSLLELTRGYTVY